MTVLSKTEKAALSVALSWGAGLIDIVGYQFLYHAFAAHMTGNTVSSVLHAYQRNWPELLHRCAPVPAFFAGLLAGEITLERAKRGKGKHVAAQAFVIEAILLAVFLIVGWACYGATPHFRKASSGMFVFLISLNAYEAGR